MWKDVNMVQVYYARKKVRIIVSKEMRERMLEDWKGERKIIVGDRVECLKSITI